MGRLISASLFFLLAIAPAWSQEPLQGKVERQDSAESHNPEIFQPRRAPVVQPRLPTAEDLRPVQGAVSSADSTDVWSMTVLANGGMSINSTDISWSIEYANPKLRHDWDVWLSRIMLVIYQDCSRFKCPTVSDHTCTVYVRRDGAVVANIIPDGDIPSTLFRNAVTRLQGRQVLDFPADSHQDKVAFKLNLHYGKPLPNSSIFKDAFGQPDARYPLEKTYWPN